VTLWAQLKTAAGVRGLGCRPDRVDSRDRSFTELPLGVTKAPVAHDLLDYLGEVLDQGATNACVGFSWAQALRIQMAVDGWARPFLPSPHAIYYWSRAFTGLQTTDAGSFLRDGARALERFGFPTEQAWPSKPRSVNVAPNITAFRSAADTRKLAGYYRIARGDTASMRLAIAAGRPVVFGLSLRQSFLDGNEETIDRDSGRELGGHALCCVGYSAARFRVVSSWGRLWRDNGLAWISESRMREAQDSWVCDLRS
jgi:C1A family cysteine protease